MTGLSVQLVDRLPEVLRVLPAVAVRSGRVRLGAGKVETERRAVARPFVEKQNCPVRACSSSMYNERYSASSQRASVACAMNDASRPSKRSYHALAAL